MKKFVSFLLSLAFAGSTFAQMSGYSSSQSDGTTLGANETLTADGIALGNAVKLRGYVNTILHRQDESGTGNQAEDGTFVNGDIDFLIDLSPITAEVHLAAGDSNVTGSGANIELEQAFGRYSFNQDFHITFGRQVTVLGFDSDEWTNRYAVTTAYGGDGNKNNGKAYVDGMRLNYNNGMFGFILGLHDEYGLKEGTDNDLDHGIAIDLAASVMFIPGLEARLGFVNENGKGSNDDSFQVNGWLAWNPGDLTLALEFDNFSFANDDDAWDLMLLANYQFSDLFAATLRYAHSDYDPVGSGSDKESDKITLALLLSLTDNFDLNFEYSHINNDGGNDENQFYLQALLSY